MSWNKKHNLVSTLSSDRACRTYNSATKKVVSKSYKANLNLNEESSKKKKVTLPKPNANADAEGAGAGVVLVIEAVIEAAIEFLVEEIHLGHFQFFSEKIIKKKEEIN